MAPNLDFDDEQWQIGIELLDSPADETRLRGCVLQQGPAVTAWYVNRRLL